MTQKPGVATVFLAGCFGCHMSLLDIDERFADLAEIVDFGKSPLTDIKEFEGRYTLGCIEGGCANEENVETLLRLRAHCDVLAAIGECAMQGDIPSLRNNIPLDECFDEAYRSGVTVYNPRNVLPDDPELPLLLDRVYPVQEVVAIDCFLPGCPPRASLIWEVLTAILSGREPVISYPLLKYD